MQAVLIELPLSFLGAQVVQLLRNGDLHRIKDLETLCLVGLKKARQKILKALARWLESEGGTTDWPKGELRSWDQKVPWYNKPGWVYRTSVVFPDDANSVWKACFGVRESQKASVKGFQDLMWLLCPNDPMEKARVKFQVWDLSASRPTIWAGPDLVPVVDLWGLGPFD